MAIDTVKLINYLAYGVSPSQISAALSISPSRVTQLAKEERVMDLVAARKAEIAAEELDKKANLQTAASTLLDSIMELAKETESLGEAVRAYEILQKLTATQTQDGPEAKVGSQTLVVQIPIFVQQALQIETNSKNEIVELAGRSMATMPTKETYALLTQGKEQEEQEEEW